MKKYIVLITLFFILFIFSKCKNENIEETTPLTKNFVCDTISPSYARDIIPIIITHCSDTAFGNCHQDNSQNVHLNDYDEVKFLVDEGHIEEHVIDRPEMPPPYSLGPTELPHELIEKIYCWIEYGAQHN
jgi:hypothetical protein